MKADLVANGDEPERHEVEGKRKIVLRDVHVEYGNTVILKGISLAVNDGELVSVIGASGCGKTTLLHVVSGLVDHRSGDVMVNGTRVRGAGSDRVMVFQEDAVFPWLTVRRNIEYGLRIKKLGPNIRRERVKAALDLVGLAGSEGLYPRQLSGGMRKRVDLARALAVEPEMLLMDEPYAALDAMTKERMQVEFLRIQRKTAMTVLFVTHDLEEAAFLGDRIVVMAPSPGRIHSVIDVSFERERPVELKRTPVFQALCADLGRRLEETGMSRIAAIS